MIEIEKNTKVYILCPAYLKTGGTELAHQLAHRLDNDHIDVYMVYMGTKKDNIVHRPSAFDKYIIKECKYEEIVDDENNIVILPEIYPYMRRKWKKIRTVIWWMSVDNYVNYNGIINPIRNVGIISFLKRLIRKRISLTTKDIKSVDYHLVQSYYAKDYILKQGIEQKNIYYLSDYINSEFMNKQINLENKEDIVLYNPRKGYKFTQKIMKNSDKKFVALQNMTTEEIANILVKSKVYIDFGEHPGKDRFPREAAMCGCCVITGKRGSARFKEDVPILEEFKFEDKNKNLEKINTKIDNCIKDYATVIKKFDEYKEFIRKEEEKFNKDVETIFNKANA